VDCERRKGEHLLLGDAPLDVAEPLGLLQRGIGWGRRYFPAPLGEL